MTATGVVCGSCGSEMSETAKFCSRERRRQRLHRARPLQQIGTDLPQLVANKTGGAVAQNRRRSPQRAIVDADTD
jgi:hypothetical protein